MKRYGCRSQTYPIFHLGVFIALLLLGESNIIVFYNLKLTLRQALIRKIHIKFMGFYPLYTVQFYNIPVELCRTRCYNV